MKKSRAAIKEERKTTLKMIDVSRELAERLGEHKLKPGCNCIACVNKRKNMLHVWHKGWEYEL